MSGKIRPLGLGHTIRCAGAKSFAKMFHEQAQSAAGVQRYGLGHRQGAELVHQTAAGTIAARSHQAVLSLDVILRACIRRSEVSSAAQIRLRHLVPWLAGLINHRIPDSCRLDSDELRLSMDGRLDQGCLLCLMLFWGVTERSGVDFTS